MWDTALQGQQAIVCWGLTGSGSQYHVTALAPQDGTYNLDLAEENGITDVAGSLSSDVASDRWSLHCQLVSGKTAGFIPLQTIINTQNDECP